MIKPALIFPPVVRFEECAEDMRVAWLGLVDDTSKLIAGKKKTQENG